MAQTDHIEGLLAFLLASTRREPTALESHYDVSNIENNYTLNSDEILSGADSHHSMKWDYYWHLIDEATKGERLSTVTGKNKKEWSLSIQTLNLMLVWPSGWDVCEGLSPKVQLILFSVYSAQTQLLTPWCLVHFSHTYTASEGAAIRQPLEIWWGWSSLHFKEGFQWCLNYLHSFTRIYNL